MKRSDLKAFIKENIIQALSEEPIPGFGVGKDDKEMEDYKKDFESAKKASELPPDASIEDVLAFYKKNPPKGIMEEDEDDKDAIKGAMGARGKFKKLDLAVKALKDLETEMKSLARKYSNADDAEKEKIKDTLREKTPKKKELEALVAKLEDDVV